jgi:tight adherence protein C
MSQELSVHLITFLAFGAVAIGVYAIGQFLAVQIRVHQRIAAQGQDAAQRRDDEVAPGLASGFDALVSTIFEEKRFGVEGSVRTKLRRELIRAGFFRVDAINYYIFARVATVIIFVIVVLIVEQFMANSEWYLRLGLAVVVILLAVVGPDAYIARQKRVLHLGYRIAFPDMLDLLVVCIDAGLSLEAALDRISGEVGRQNRHLGANLQIMGAEMRAGRSTIDALASLADRLGLDEARSLAAMLRQSIELGTDVGDALRVFSDDMRDRRLLRAEERANQLPVKLVGPLGLFIFPVILGMALVPVMIRLITVVLQ